MDRGAAELTVYGNRLSGEVFPFASVPNLSPEAYGRFCALMRAATTAENAGRAMGIKPETAINQPNSEKDAQIAAAEAAMGGQVVAAVNANNSPESHFMHRFDAPAPRTESITPAQSEAPVQLNFAPNLTPAETAMMTPGETTDSPVDAARRLVAESLVGAN